MLLSTLPNASKTLLGALLRIQAHVRATCKLTAWYCAGRRQLPAQRKMHI